MILALLLLVAVCTAFGIGTGPLAINVIGISASVELGAHDVSTAAGWIPQWVATAMSLFFAWCYAAISIKRLHDRDKNGWWMIPFVAASGLHSQLGPWLGDSWMASFAGFVVPIGFFWGLVEMYFLKGTDGPNRFGTDPLAANDFAATAGPRWDQQAELQFVPYSAGPPPGAHVMRRHD